MQCSKLRIFSIHTQGAQVERIMYPASFLHVHNSYIKVFIILKNHAPSGCTGADIYATGSQNYAHRMQSAPLISNAGMHDKVFLNHLGWEWEETVLLKQRN